jgi:predicted helicase
MTDTLMDNGIWAASATLVLSRYLYHAPAKPGSQASLSERAGSGRRHNITEHALDLYRALDPEIAKDDIFFYVYAILHSPDYREAYGADLRKSLPRIPKVETANDFWAFSRAGRDLAQLHTKYEEVEPWRTLQYTIAKEPDIAPEELYRVVKMRYADDETTVVYNDRITISDIPARVHDYRLGARSALDWVLETNRVRTDKKSGITNDPNDWAIEYDSPTYIFDLVGRIVTVSMRTLDIVDELPHLEL